MISTGTSMDHILTKIIIIIIIDMEFSRHTLYNENYLLAYNPIMNVIITFLMTHNIYFNIESVFIASHSEKFTHI